MEDNDWSPLFSKAREGIFKLIVVSGVERAVGHQVVTGRDESLKRFSGEGKKRKKMEKSILGNGTPKSAVGPGD